MEATARRLLGPTPTPPFVSSLLRARRLVQRNMLVYRHGWIIIVSGFFEPLFYLLGIGFGLGSLTEGVTLTDGRTIPYQAFVAPGLLAMSTLNGAIAESIFNVFFKLNFAHIYDGILATPLGIREIAIGELIWSLMRGSIYVIAFLGVMLALGLILSPWAILVPAAAVLLGAAFSAAGLATTAYLRTVQDFDLPMGLVVMPMFLFSGVFFPVTFYPV
ncbi:MAG TPA: ABC transporter permease, partial [Candidatus Limnocylindria bacterium]|nr:ABC transporter permease [Candidatus Limnocylindria bacterium]